MTRGNVIVIAGEMLFIPGAKRKAAQGRKAGVRVSAMGEESLIQGPVL